MSDEIKPTRPLPWRLYYGDDEAYQQQTIISDDDVELWSSYPGGFFNNAANEDAEYAVHAANEYPALKARVKELEAIAEEAWRLMSGLGSADPNDNDSLAEACFWAVSEWEKHTRKRARRALGKEAE